VGSGECGGRYKQTKSPLQQRFHSYSSTTTILYTHTHYYTHTHTHTHTHAPPAHAQEVLTLYDLFKVGKLCARVQTPCPCRVVRAPVCLHATTKINPKVGVNTPTCLHPHHRIHPLKGYDRNNDGKVTSTELKEAMKQPELHRLPMNERAFVRVRAVRMCVCVCCGCLRAPASLLETTWQLPGHLRFVLLEL
jgi:hypothetical protein